MKAILWLLLFLIWTSSARAQSPFYAGKTITVVAGVSAGSAYDLYARLMAQYMGKHIPGNPTFVVQNMTGAGSIIGANYLYNISKPDGLTIGAIQPSIFFNQLMNQKEVKFDWGKFTWIGSSDKSDHLLYMRADLPYKSLADVRRAPEPPKCGSTGAGTSGSYIPKMLEEILGTKFTIVAGYQGGGEIDLAVERGELQCRALTIQAYHSREPYHTWRRTNFARIVMQTGRTRDPRIADAPTLHELMNEHKTPESGRRLVPLVMAGSDFGRPIIAPPGVPPDKIKILREAFNKTMADPELLADAKRKNFDIAPTPGEELEALAKEVVAQPPEIVERLRNLMSQ
ncbi:MAG TPA: tripartite tricarboxylate transporter substrate-binding protein [Candidatus Binatia bacterium]|nr:tripartite tricarboxylate transporter substrate-binding protein [Candidatus Binatia bacterium]HYQ97707.1 tripartite tricarboxylate transporter substrate-binding protein [Candidatus Nitrosocosmicus sp.]